MVADELDYVVGVDTHLDEHVLAVVAAPSAAVVARRSVRASGRGYAAALRFAAETANGRRVQADLVETAEHGVPDHHVADVRCHRLTVARVLGVHSGTLAHATHLAP